MLLATFSSISLGILLILDLRMIRYVDLLTVSVYVMDWRNIFISWCLTPSREPSSWRWNFTRCGSYCGWPHFLSPEIAPSNMVILDLSEYSLKPPSDIAGETRAKHIARSLPSLPPLTAYKQPLLVWAWLKLPGYLLWNTKCMVFTTSRGKVRFKADQQGQRESWQAHCQGAEVKLERDVFLESAINHDIIE